jgi:hypothetical protein
VEYNSKNNKPSSFLYQFEAQNSLFLVVYFPPTHRRIIKIKETNKESQGN